MKKPCLYLLFICLSLGASLPALSCGFCAGDKEAAVFSQENSDFAKAQGHQYLTVIVEGDCTEQDFKQTARGLSRLDGVFPKSVKTSFDQKAISLVFKKDHSFENLLVKFSKNHSRLKLINSKDWK